MKIAQDSVVSFHYTLRDEAGEVIDQSRDEPLAYLHGHGQIIPGLERELAGRAAGERLQVRVAPEEAYGQYDEALLQQVPREAFSQIPGLQVGMSLQARTSDGGAATVRVKDIGEEFVTVDRNHALAGKALVFDVEIAEVRVATGEELEHQHVHGPGGHHH